jgi:CheY-like chemotaxis protein
MLSSASEEAVKVIPSILWVLFALGALVVFRKTIRDEIVPRLASVKLPGGIELVLREKIAAAAEQHGVPVSDDDTSRIVRRFERQAELVRGTRILWLDDDPAGNANETDVLRTFGASIDFVTTSADLVERLDRRDYDVVISDIAREDGTGVQFLAETKGVPYTILYITDFQPELGTPAYAFAITDEPHQLLHYVLDVIERERG